jgi:hypothetical protein
MAMLRFFRYRKKVLNPRNLVVETLWDIVSEREVFSMFYDQWVAMNIVSFRLNRTSQAECLSDWIEMYNAEEVFAEQIL